MAVQVLPLDADHREDLVASEVGVEIDAASINTGDEQRVGHLRSPDFLDIDRFPTLIYRGTHVRSDGLDRVERRG